MLGLGMIVFHILVNTVFLVSYCCIRIDVATCRDNNGV